MTKKHSIMQCPRRGIALLSALFLSTFIFILVMSLLTLAEEDGTFSRQQERAARAYYTAKAGLELFKEESEVFPADTDVVHHVLDSNYLQTFTLRKSSVTGDITSLGIVQLPGTPPVEVARCTLEAPGGDFTRVLNLGN
jgi:hypothetical protein